MSKTRYTCQECGAHFLKWAGRCENCHSWNSLIQEVYDSKATYTKPNDDFFQNLCDQGLLDNSPRLSTAMGEFDRVCGGGLVKGSVILIGGDPGIGKSTLLLQIVASMGAQYHCAYISGEESTEQIRLRAERLGLRSHPVHLAAATQLSDIMGALQNQTFDIVIIDSIQTIANNNIESAPGSVSQVRACAFELIQLAKKKGFILVLVGHVTKEGALAGPRVLEHMVDTVLYFEGDNSYDYRLLRSVKNRFGPSHEIGVFAMEEKGLRGIENPSALFLTHHDTPISGSAIYAGIEGTRPLLIEVQALVSPTAYATPKRTTVGWDLNRLSMIVAVLEARCGLRFSGYDIYLNVVGGLKITEPAADLAMAASLISALKNQPLMHQAVYFGEIGLTGEVRATAQSENRLKEMMRLGYTHAIFKGPIITTLDLVQTEIKNVQQIVSGMVS